MLENILRMCSSGSKTRKDILCWSNSSSKEYGGKVLDVFPEWTTVLCNKCRGIRNEVGKIGTPLCPCLLSSEVGWGKICEGLWRPCYGVRSYSRQHSVTTIRDFSPWSNLCFKILLFWLLKFKSEWKLLEK